MLFVAAWPGIWPKSCTSLPACATPVNDMPLAAFPMLTMLLVMSFTPPATRVPTTAVACLFKLVFEGSAKTRLLYSLWVSRGCPSSHMNIVRLVRSEEHTSELQSLRHLVCRLLLEK